ncbi:MAG: type III polyketide synthase [Pseudomonadota bacterium]
MARLLALTTATPPHRVKQSEAKAVARELYGRQRPDIDRYLPVFDNAGIDSRALAMPIDWYLEPHGWRDRNEVYAGCAIDLLAQTAVAALDQAGLRADEVDALVVVSSTGVSTPSLDAFLMDRLPFRRDVLRLPIFGLGCAGGVSGLARAAMMARAMPGSNVLLLAVELCSLAFRVDDASKAGIVAAALFADGAAAAIVRHDEAEDGPRLVAWGEHCWPSTLDIMGWRVEDDGLGVIFARSIPHLVRQRFVDALDGFLAQQSLGRDGLDGYVCHPGGAKVLAALEDELQVAAPGLVAERAVLAAHGNMSAVTVLFVLAQRLGHGIAGRHALTSLGPGFTAAFVLADF